MVRKKSAKQKERDRIRKRDRRWFPRSNICFMCNEEHETEIHHHRYEIEYDPINFCEVCELCHKRIHGLRLHPNDSQQ